MELNGSELLSRPVKLDFARERGAYTPNTGYFMIAHFVLLQLFLSLYPDFNCFLIFLLMIAASHSRRVDRLSLTQYL